MVLIDFGGQSSHTEPEVKSFYMQFRFRSAFQAQTFFQSVAVVQCQEILHEPLLFDMSLGLSSSVAAWGTSGLVSNVSGLCFRCCDPSIWAQRLGCDGLMLGNPDFEASRSCDLAHECL